MRLFFKSSSVCSRCSILRTVTGGQRVYWNRYNIPHSQLFHQYSSNFSGTPFQNANIEQKNDDNTVTHTQIASILKRHVWPDTKETRLRTVLAVSSMLSSKLINVSVPFLFKGIIDHFTVSTMTDASLVTTLLPTIPLTLIFGYGIARCMASITREAQSAVFANVTQRGTKRMAEQLFTHLHRLDLEFHLNRQTGILSKSIDRGIRGVTYICNTMLLNVVPTALEVALVSSILGYHFGPMYAFVTSGTLGLYILFTVGVTQWRTRLRQEMNRLDNQSSAHVIDSLINYETVKYFNNEKLECDKYSSVMAKYQSSAIKVQTSLSMLNAGQNIIFSTGLTTVMILAAMGMSAGTMTIGDLVLVNSLLFQLSVPLNFVGSVYREVKLALTDLENMIRLIQLTPKIQDKPNAIALESNHGKVEFDNVHFGYQKERSILNGASFTVEPQKSIAIVGLSGSGKSTILRLLYRFYDANSGSVKIDDTPVDDITLDSLRSKIGVVPQDIVLFNDTIYHNLSYGNANSTRDEVMDAAKKAQIHDFITKQPRQYETMVGERGLKLSGGEKQRVAIARMLLKNAQIVVCDEATNSLDSQTEADILKSLKEVTAGKTRIFVAHRLSSITDVDTILVIDNGSIAESGTHSDLLKLNQKYAQMWRMQNIA